ncbi:MAG: bifunctional N(6)-L-threonylcarbamoyladenine synthase/serine/threonine protein kinase [DPANN group archaeon]|nr:bifunctional N(6)-L-threonylcarbamoyladenine synthase/serine/threonine protein kinase [DPANN group archaeon]
MICLGIESTAHTLGIGIVDSNGNILANEKKSFFPDEGIHPREAAVHHTNHAVELVAAALLTAKISVHDIDLISFSQGPGLSPSLKVGAVVARTLALGLKKPILGVNHCIAHIEIGKLKTAVKDPIIVYASGGNTQIIGFTGGKYRVFGETLDIGIGNMIDKFARKVGLGNPGGPIIEKIAKKGKYIDMPYSIKGMDMSFSGLLTFAADSFLIKKEKIEDVCYSLQHNAYSMLVEVTERALSHTGKNEVLLTGGVAASKIFQGVLGTMCSERGAKFNVVPANVAGDNGAMIAWLGLIEYKAGRRQEINETEPDPKWRTDEVEIGY